MDFLIGYWQHKTSFDKLLRSILFLKWRRESVISFFYGRLLVWLFFRKAVFAQRNLLLQAVGVAVLQKFSTTDSLNPGRIFSAYLEYFMCLAYSGNAMNILNNWKVVELQTIEGELLICLEGRVYGSKPRFPSSSHVRTSPVTGYRLEANSMVVTTRRGSEYLLGKPDPRQVFAQQRLIRRLTCLSQQRQSTFNELESQVTGQQPDEIPEDKPFRIS